MLSSRKTRLWILYSLSALFVILGSAGGALAEAQDAAPLRVQNKKILIITSQLYVTAWFTGLNNALVDNLYAGLSPQPKLSYEYIDSENIADHEFLENFLKLLRKKYSRLDLDLVIGVMPTSSRILLDYGEEIFPGIPKLYALPAKGQVKKILSAPGTGLVESTSDISGTIERVMTFFPDTKHLTVVSGSGSDDLYYLEMARDALASTNWPGSITFLSGLPPQELAETLSHLAEHSAILMLTYVKDRNGSPCTTIQVMKQIIPGANAPIFGFYDTILGEGIIGGRLTSAESYGKAISVAALELLSGGRRIIEPVNVSAEIRDMYDWRQLKRWGIPGSRIPAGSIVRYRELSFWEANHMRITIAAAVFLTQALLIFTLLVNLIRRRRFQQALAVKEQELRRSNRALKTISSCNKEIVKVVDETMFLHKVCEVLLAEGGYRLAWVGYKEEDNAKQVIPVAQAGYEDGYLKTAAITWADNEYGQGPTGRAIRTGMPCLARNIPADPSFAPWRDDAVLRGFASSIAIPLISNGEPFGALNIYASEPDAFDETEIVLLSELTNDIVFGIEAMRNRHARKKAEEALEKQRDNLEEIVKERTAALVDMNERFAAEIDDRIRIEERLVRSEAKFRDLVESANSVIMRWMKDGSITYFNRYACEFFGYDEKEIIGRNIMDTIVPPTESSGRDLPPIIQDITVRPEAYTRNVNENMRKNGERAWIAWTNKPIVDESGNVLEILSIGNDITKLKDTEEELRKTLVELAAAKERAESADNLKSAFLATMSHELRTPLNSIIGFTGIILRERVGPLNDGQRKQLNMVRDSSRHLLALINDILDISKIEAGQLQLVQEDIDLRRMIEKVEQSVRPLAESKGLELGCEISAGINAIPGDSRRLEQVLLNLLSNAIKFTEKGSVKIVCESGEYNVVVRVIDTGIGIKAEDLETIFESFRQIDSGLSRKYDGTGLGLSISKKLVELLGGKIRVTSTWGAGSAFSLSLPRVRENSERRNEEREKI